MSTAGADTGLALSVEQTQPMPLSGALRCEAGELTALVGPSGAGKTSLLRVLAGLLRPRQARLSVAGQLWMDTEQGVCWSPQARRVGLVFQHYALMPHLSALDNVALPLGHLPRPQARREAAQWLERVALAGDVLQRRPAALSGGQQQRVAMARALARQPRLLLLDEPFSAVDQMTRRSLYQVLAELRRDLAIPIVLVTHDLAEARVLADRLVVMDQGLVLQQGTPASVYRTPRNARVADLMGIHNRFAGIWEGAADLPGRGRLRWRAADGDVDPAWPVLSVVDKGRLAAGQSVTWVVAGDGLELVDGPCHAPGHLRVRIAEVRHLGETTLASLRLAAWPTVQLSMTLSGPQQRRLVEGASATIALDLDKVHVMPLR